MSCGPHHARDLGEEEHIVLSIKKRVTISPDIREK